MPLIARALCAYVAGLLGGFSAWSLVVPATAVVGLIAALRRRSTTAAGLALALAAGWLAAQNALVAEERCAATVRGSARLRVMLDDDARPGGVAHARLVACDLQLTMAISSGTARAGSLVDAQGDVSSGRRAIQIDDARLRLVRGPGVLARWRAASTRAVDAVFERDAPLARALLVADMERIPREMRDDYAASGLAHMLSVSGLHVGIIAVALEICLGAARIARRSAGITSMIAIGVYVAMIGAPPPAVRAGVMLAVHTGSRLAQRPTSPWAILALGAAAPLAHPRTALDVGWQLSVVGVAALAAAPPVASRLGVAAWNGWRRSVATGFVASAVATLATAPLVAWHFGRVSAIGPVSNLVAAPVIAVAQPMLFLGLLLAPFASVAHFVADATHPLLTAVNALAHYGARVPLAQLVVAPTAGDALLGALFAVSVLAAAAGWRTERAVIIALAALAALAWRPMLQHGSGDVEVHMIDVGQGDAIAVRTPRGRWLLFDAGGAWRTGDAGRSIVVPYLSRRGGDLAGFVLSHPHTDHVGGAASVIRTLRPAWYADAAFAAGNRAYDASLRAARDAGTRWGRVHPGDSLVIDGVVVRWLAPDSAWTASLTDPNLASTIALVRYGERRFLFVGDAEAPEEAWVLAHAASLRADVLKVGHHGSKTSSSPAFLVAVRPRVALVSVGADNMYGHPSRDVLRALSAHGAQVLRTDITGTIVVRTDGRRLWVKAQGETWELP